MRLGTRMCAGVPVPGHSGAAYARYVIAGTYELMYEFSNGSFQIPYNTMADLGCYTVP